MEKQEFIDAIKAQNQIIEKANETIFSLKAEFIASNPHYNIDEKVTITTPAGKKYNWRTSKNEDYPETTRFAFVVGYALHDNGEFTYRLRKCKKDGTRSEINDYLMGNDILEDPR